MLKLAVRAALRRSVVAFTVVSLSASIAAAAGVAPRHLLEPQPDAAAPYAAQPGIALYEAPSQATTATGRYGEPMAFGAQTAYDTTPADGAEAIPSDIPTVDPSAGMLAAAANTSTAYPNDQFHRQLMAARGEPTACGPQHRTGPGRCDDWLVGPNWRVSLDGVLLYRDSVPIEALYDANPPAPDPAPFEVDNFNHASGARLMAFGHWPQCRGYELMIGYVGVQGWGADALFPATTVTPAGSDVDFQQQRKFEYDSRLHSLELNFQELNDGSAKAYLGVRYFSLDETIDDRFDQFDPDPLNPTPLIGTEFSVEIDRANTLHVDNDLIGFQSGVRVDLWSPGPRFYVSGFGNAGVYCNMVHRTRYVRQQSTTISLDDPTTLADNEASQTVVNTGTRTSTRGANVAFAGEASIAAVLQLNRCTSLRGGYQAMYIDGVELAEDAWLTASPRERDLLLHGWFAGLEYRR
ncbi:hypothetical protein Mal64_37740 [Pseudobythopirellula maris]|uniref:Secreted protein n=1 Tax=Pseudobythopirellula maris TaxID=2527991 RepID=A0A5C5ZHV9_9BACT|nr:hypothetical protein [Pseudobythopirellula maris]TWT86944.1 hypothetical protein Mal64_37740 [Pseudobythopirellula maris]